MSSPSARAAVDFLEELEAEASRAGNPDPNSWSPARTLAYRAVQFWTADYGELPKRATLESERARDDAARAALEVLDAFVAGNWGER